MSKTPKFDTTVLFDVVLGLRIHTERRRSDGLTWLQIDDGFSERARWFAIPREMASALARALVEEPPSPFSEDGSR